MRPWATPSSRTSRSMPAPSTSPTPSTGTRPDVIGARLDQPAARSLRPARPVLRRQPHGQMVVPAALSAERLPAPSTRSPRVSMALSLGLHGLAVLLLLAAGAAGSVSTERTGLPRRAHPRRPRFSRGRPRSTPPRRRHRPCRRTPQRLAERGSDRAGAARRAAAARRRRTSKPVEPPKPANRPPAAARAAAAGRPSPPRPNARRAQELRHGERGAAGPPPASSPAPAIVWEGIAALSPSAHARRLPAARHRAQPAGRGSGAGAARPRRLGRRDRAVPRQRLRAARQGRAGCRAAAGTSCRRCAMARPVAAWVEIPVRFHLR